MKTLYRNKLVKSGAGFTLIELLVVIAIIGLLSSIVLASLNSARGKARDARRKADIKQLKIALEFYYDKYNGYPFDTVNNWDKTCSGVDDMSVLVTEGFIAKVPCDPLNTGIEGSGTGYGYFFDPDGICSSVCSTFNLYTNLEDGTVFSVKD